MKPFTHITARFLALAMTLAPFAGCGAPTPPVRIGYFHGGRTQLLARIHNDYEFAAAGVEVKMWSRDLNAEEFELMPHSIREFNAPGTDIVGKVRGTELIEHLLRDEYDLTTPGESSFIMAMRQGLPVVAIAELGHDVRNQSGHVIMMRNGMPADHPGDYFGQVLVSRRAGPGDSIMLKEYLERIGVNLEEDIVQLDALPRDVASKDLLPNDFIYIVDQLYEPQWAIGTHNCVIDGGYFHLMGVPAKIKKFWIVAALQDWVDPELSHALIVSTPEYVAANRERLIRLMETYILRIKAEHALSYEERTRRDEKGIQMAMDYYGLNLPQYDIVPTVSVELLTMMARLLRKYGFIEEEIDVASFVDNSLVLEALENLDISEEDDYWGSEF
ncbi:MAG: hypothetical protein CME06_13325 [Gemmatimonadetes bacterium]|nr:hypothetical protein [Gemmatimonadota bacterium]